LDGIQSLDRALAILRVLAKHGNEGMRLVEIYPLVDLTKSTAHRILQALTQSGIVTHERGLYYLGYDLFTLGVAAGNRFGLSDLARPSLVRLAERTGDTIYLSIRDRFDAVCIARQEGDFPIKTLTLKLGDRRPLGVGAGSLALLSFTDDEDVRNVVGANFGRSPPYPRYDETSVYSMIETSRRQGYAVNEGNVIPGMSAIGVPIRSSTGVVAALSVAAITERMRMPRRTNVVTWLQTEAAEVERLLHPLGHVVLQTELRPAAL
jgi:DNA-binding IclR family transcriptional regulator